MAEELSVHEYQDRAAKEYEKLAKERLVWTPRQLQDSPFAMQQGKSPEDLARRLLQENKPDSPALPAFAREPEYKKLMQDLKVRHEQEREQLVQKQQQQQRAETSRKEPMPLKDFEDMLLRHVKEREQLYTRYAAEIDRYTREYQNAKRKPDAEFTAKVQFTQDPAFIKLQRDLQLRQDQERKDLLQKQEQQRIGFGRQPGVTRQQLDDNYQRQIQERDAQGKKHKAEQERYIREYHDAKVLREELREREKSREQTDKLTR